GSTQHLANALIPIIAEGGLALGDDRLVPRLLLMGRDAERLAAVAHTHKLADWTIDLDAALADPAYAIFFDAAATQGRVAVLERALAAGKHVSAKSQWPRPPLKAWICCARRSGAASSTASSRTRSIFRDCRSSPRSRGAATSDASSDSGSSSAGG